MTDHVFTAAAVRTHDRVIGTSILVRSGRIAAIGGDELVRPGISHHVFPGQVIVPGLVDAHFHPIGYTASLHRPSLKAAADFHDIAAIIGEAADRQPVGTAVAALRLDDESLAEGRLPDREFLDSVVPDRPVLLMRYCGHVAVANTRGLEAAGVTAATPDPVGGSFDRDGAGRPTGIARETAAEILSAALRRAAPPITPEHVVQAATALASLGITALGGIVGSSAGCWAGPGSELDALLAAAPDLPIRVAAFVIAPGPTELRQAAEALKESRGPVTFAGVKMFGDGSLGGHTAAMQEPYADAPRESGTHRLDPDHATLLATTALDLEGRVAIHAIGDAANRRALDFMEGLVVQGADPARLRIEHASVLAESDIERFGRLGVTASVQPAFLASETSWLESRLGPDRLRRAYPFRSLRQVGAPLAGGSDCPVEPPHPLAGMAAARDRCGIIPEQGLDGGEALALFTDWAATAIGETAGFGPLADFTVLDCDPVIASPAELRTARAVATVIGGETIRSEGTAAWPD
jgi:predicted amidohydrolase YtcJ